MLQVVARSVANPTKQEKGKEGTEGAGEFEIAIWVADAVEADVFTLKKAHFVTISCRWLWLYCNVLYYLLLVSVYRVLRYCLLP